MNYPLKDLNPEQLTVVNSIEGPLLVLAGPGTGKTQLLSIRTANILEKKKASPENILILTFTNSAAKAMKERLAKIIWEEGYRVEVSTYHSFARNYIILDSEEAINYIGERVQITDIERTRAIEYILDNVKGLEAIRPFGAPYAYRPDIEKKISELKNEGISPKEFQECVNTLIPDGAFIEEKHIPRLKALAKAYQAYEELKSGQNKGLFDQRGRFDYDDIIIIATEVLKKEKALRDKYLNQYRYLMVDEFQDSNGAQLELLFNLVDERHPNLCCVGDDDQSIYRFQGANVGNFKLLKARFPHLKVVSLKANYRSTREIIDLSSKIIKNIPKAERVEEKAPIPKVDYSNKLIEFFEFSTEHEELLFIVKKVQEIKKLIENSKELPDEEKRHPYNNIAILVRKRNYILKIIDAFLASGIPYSTDGKEDISQEKRVRQLLDVLDLAYINIKGENEEDLALFKVLSSDYLEIPPSELLTFIGNVRKKKETGLLEALLRNPSPRFKKVASIISKLLQDARSKPLHTMLMQYMHDVGIYRFLLKAYDKNKTIRIRDLRAITSFLNLVKGSDYSKPGIGLDEFMEEIKTKKEHGIPIEGELVTLSQDGVRIYTAHGSKGQEFHTVIIPFCIQNKSWPVKPMGDKLPLPAEVYKTRERIQDKKRLKQLMQYDETRLFYVASSRAKANLIFTASPTEDDIYSFYLKAIDIKPKKMQFDEDKLLLDSLNKNYEENLSRLKTNEVIKSLIKELVLTPTKLNNYIKCKRKFFYDNILKLPGKKRPGLVFGNCSHKALEETYRKFKEEGKFPEFNFFEDIFKRELKFQGVDKSIEKGCLDKLETLKLWFKNAKKNPIKPLGLEKSIPITIGDGIRFTGKYDKVEIEDEKGGLVRVIDYKTGKPDKHIKTVLNFSGDLKNDDNYDYIRQLVSYKMLFETEKTGAKKYKVSHGVLAFLEPVDENAPRYNLTKGEFRNEKVEITDEMVADLEVVIKDVWQNIQRLMFDKLPERDISKCRTCEFDTICWC